MKKKVSRVRKTLGGLATRMRVQEVSGGFVTRVKARIYELTWENILPGNCWFSRSRREDDVHSAQAS